MNQGLPTLGVTLAANSVAGTYPLPLLLAVQDGFISLAARGSVTLGNVYDPPHCQSILGSKPTRRDFCLEHRRMLGAMATPLGATISLAMAQAAAFR